jgi:hypothetical protein
MTATKLPSAGRLYVAFIELFYRPKVNISLRERGNTSGFIVGLLRLNLIIVHF